MFHSSGLTRLPRVLWKQRSRDLSNAELITVWRRFHHLPIQLPVPAIWPRTDLFSLITHFREASTPGALEKKHQKCNMLFAFPSTWAVSHPSCRGKPLLSCEMSDGLGVVQGKRVIFGNPLTFVPAVASTWALRCEIPEAFSELLFCLS